MGALLGGGCCPPGRPFTHLSRPRVHRNPRHLLRTTGLRKYYIVSPVHCSEWKAVVLHYSQELWKHIKLHLFYIQPTKFKRLNVSRWNASLLLCCCHISTTTTKALIVHQQCNPRYTKKIAIYAVLPLGTSGALQPWSLILWWRKKVGSWDPGCWSFFGQN